MKNIGPKRTIFLLIHLANISAVCYSQLPDYHIQLLDENNGIQTSTVRHMTRDKNGFLWLLSPRLVQRYDGKNTMRFNNPGDESIEILADSSNRIWISSVTTIKVFINDYKGFQTVKCEDPGKEAYYKIPAFYKLQVTPDRRVWAMSNNGPYLFDESSQSFRLYPVKGITTKQFGRNTLQLHGDQLFFASSDSVFCWNTRTNSVKRVAFSYTRTLMPLNDDVVWITSHDWKTFEADFNKSAVRPISISQFSPLPSVMLFDFRTVFPLSDHEYFVTTSTGCYRYDRNNDLFKKITLYRGGIPLSEQQTIYAGFVDDQKNVWILSEEGIVFFHTFGEHIGWLRNYNNEWDNNIRTIAEDGKGNIWLATSKGFSMLNPETGYFKSYIPNSKPGSLFTFPSVRGFAFDGKNLLIGPTRGGVIIFNPATETFSRPVYPAGKTGDSMQGQLENDFITSIVRLHNGNHLVLAQRGIYLIHASNYKIEALSFNGSRFNMQSAVVNSKNQLFFATGKGVVFVDSAFKTIQVDTNFSDSRLIRTLLLKNDSTVWAANFGIFEITFTRQGIQKKIVIPELQNQIIASFYRDHIGKIWIGTDNGIYRYTETDGRLESFDIWDNVQNKMINPNSVFHARNGILYIGGYNGLNYFIPEKIATNPEMLKVLVSNVRVNGQDDSSFFLKKYPLQLRYRQNSVEVQFAAPYFHNPKKIQYRYLLEGLDTGWVSNGRNNVVRFSSLPAGSYDFQAAASLDGQTWFESQKPFSFTIHPPFWKTWWFRLLCLLALIGIGLQVFYNYKKRAERKTMQQMIAYFANSGYEHATVDDILWDITRNCVSRLNFEDCVIYILDDRKNVLVQRAALGVKNPKEKEIYNPLEIPLGRGIVGAVAETGKAEIIGDTSKDSRYIVDDIRRSSEIAIPIIYNEQVLGVIDSEHPRKNFYTKRHLQVLQSIASICSTKIARVMAEQETANKENKMKELDRMMKENRLAALQAQMNPHFIFNAMNSIQQFTLQNDVDNANKYLSRFSKLLREVLHQSQKNTVTLAEEIELLQLYLQIEALRMSNDFSFQIEVDGDIETDAIKIPVMIIQPFVENALIHGLSAKHGPKELSVKFKMKSENILVCEVTDNGIGREKAKEFRLQRKGLLKHESKGMQMVKERLQLFNGTTNDNSHVSVFDLKNDTGENQGTKVVIEIPI